MATTDYAVNRDAKVSAYLAGEKVDPATVACVSLLFFSFLFSFSWMRTERPSSI